MGTMKTKFRLAAGAGAAALIAVAGCTQAAAHSTQPAKQTTQKTASAKVQAATTAPQPATASSKSKTSTTAFTKWWAGEGYKQYARVAKELNLIMVMDVVQDKDANFESDARQLAADATLAAANPPPIDAKDYLAAMHNFARGGQAAATGSYGRAFNSVKAGLQQMVAFNMAAGLTAASVPPGSN
jgi:hypothetical protein